MTNPYLWAQSIVVVETWNMARYFPTMPDCLGMDDSFWAGMGETWAYQGA